MKTLLRATPLLFALMVGLSACGGGDAPAGETSDAASTDGGLTQTQLENGIGPINEVVLGDLDPALVATGEASFNAKCSACHKMTERYVGPPLGDVLARRSPEYIMNMMLNPDGMVKEHPEAKAMLADYMTPMPNQNLDEAEARALLEYLRTQQVAGATADVGE